MYVRIHIQYVHIYIPGDSSTLDTKSHTQIRRSFGVMHRETPPSNRWTTKTPRSTWTLNHQWNAKVRQWCGQKVHVKETNRPIKQRENKLTYETLKCVCWVVPCLKNWQRHKSGRCGTEVDSGNSVRKNFRLTHNVLKHVTCRNVNLDKQTRHIQYTPWKINMEPTNHPWKERKMIWTKPPWLWVPFESSRVY